MNRYSPAYRNRAHRLSGFTLIEALFALAILAILLPVVMEGMSVVLSLSSRASHQAEAANLARSKLDEFVATSQWNGGATMNGSFEPEHPEYQWSAVVNDWQNGTMTELAVQVFWMARGQQQSVTMSTLVRSPSDGSNQ